MLALELALGEWRKPRPEQLHRLADAVLIGFEASPARGL
jgi:hypothetical protein